MRNEKSTQGEQAHPIMIDIIAELDALIAFGYLTDDAARIILDCEDIA